MATRVCSEAGLFTSHLTDSQLNDTGHRAEAYWNINRVESDLENDGQVVLQEIDLCLGGGIMQRAVEGTRPEAAG